MGNGNYPDDVNPNDPDAPWNQSDKVRCCICETELTIGDPDVIRICGGTYDVFKCKPCWKEDVLDGDTD